jgi:signal transduction histidine kinase
VVDVDVDVDVDDNDEYVRGMEHLITVVQELSHARSMETIQAIVRTAARQLTKADGATFVLKDGPFCFYVDEDAISPLWKGRRFPLQSCISGWAMMNATQAVIEDIYQDPRIPHDAYRSTFVKSLVMTPIRLNDPIGAIGAYWATQRLPTSTEVKLLQALADSTSIAIENVQRMTDLEHRVAVRTAELQVANKELESFSYSVSHDLRAPLRAVSGFAQAVLEDAGETLDDESRDNLNRVIAAAGRMNGLIEGLLDLSRVSRTKLERVPIDVTAIAREISTELKERDPSRKDHVIFEIQEGLTAEADPRLFRSALENLMSNAFKFTGRTSQATIEIGQSEDAPGEIFIKDNGIGFDMSRAHRLFGAFQRMVSMNDFPGTGIGLATVLRIVRLHGGEIHANAEPGKGAMFRFSLKPRA